MNHSSWPRAVGFVGLGDQGGPMVHRLLDAGRPVHVWARRPEATAPFVDRGAMHTPTLKALATACDLVGVCVTDDEATRDVATPLLKHLSAGSVLAIHSTVAPQTCRELSSIAAADVDVIDAPVSGGHDAAAQGRLAILVGGSADAFERCSPVFRHYGEAVHHVGPLGAGQVAKLINNALFSAHAALALEAFELAELSGISRAHFSRILATSSGRSQAQRRLDLLGAPAQRQRIHSLMDKDQRLFEALAQEYGGDVASLNAGRAFVSELGRLLTEGRGEVPPWAMSSLSE